MNTTVDLSVNKTSTSAAICWRFLSFDELTSRELYALLQLRSEIFVVEQVCVFQDMDGADMAAMHLLGTLDDELVAYARCFDAHIKYIEASIGRVVTRDRLRGTGVGHVLIRESMAAMARHWGSQPIRIGAQQRLEKFYTRHGFVQDGAPYIEDGIPHIEMMRVG